MPKRIQPEQPGLFDHVKQRERVARRFSLLDDLNAWVPWESLRPLVAKPPKGPSGRPGFDEVFMLKVLVLQRLFNLSDAQTELQIMDRASFQMFLGIGAADKVPDEKTIWAFKEPLMAGGSFELLFDRINEIIQQKGVKISSGSIVDASFVPVPVQRNTREENEILQQGRTPEAWKDHPAKLRQKDTDANWTKKHGQSYFGYKMHAKIDAKTKLITKVVTTPASVHDSQVLADLIEPTDTQVHADSAYYSEKIERMLKENNIDGQICARGRRNHPLTAEQRAINRLISKIRARGEHAFGLMETSLHGMMQRCIGLVRNEAMITFTAIVHNLVRANHLLKTCEG